MTSTDISFSQIHVPHDACLNVASVSAANVHVSAAHLLTCALNNVLLAQASAILRLLQEVRATVAKNVEPKRSVTLEISHLLTSAFIMSAS